MKSLKFTDAELLDMKQFYDRELEQTLSKLEHVRKVLKKLGANVPDVAMGVSSKGSNGTSRRGRKSKWGVFIKDQLTKSQKPLTYEELVDLAMTEFKRPESQRNNTRQAIISSAYRLRNMHDDLKTFAIKGSRIKYVGLLEWFGPTGKIKSEFSSKVSRPKAAPKPRGRKPGAKRGRPAKVAVATTAAAKAAPAKAAAAPKKAAPKPAAKKATKAPAKKAAPKKTAAAKAPAKTTAAKKTTAATAPVKKAATAKAAPKKATAAKPAAKPAAKKTAAKPAAKKAVTKPTAKKATAKPAAPKAAAKPAESTNTGGTSAS